MSRLSPSSSPSSAPPSFTTRLARGFSIGALLALLVLLAALPAEANEGAWVDPLLHSLLDQPSQEIPAFLKGEIGAYQGQDLIAGRPALSLHVRSTLSPQELTERGAVVRTWAKGLATVYLLPEDLPALASTPGVQAIHLPTILEYMLEPTGAESGITFLRNRAFGGSVSATGRGVVVGVIDSGIDVDHENFLDPLGNSRIAFALDQVAGGVTCTAADIDAGTCPIQDQIPALGHGTHVAGIAAGDGSAPDADGVRDRLVGMAPEATLVVVKSTLDTTDVVDALEWIFNRADQLDMPAVVNLSIGGDRGSHDGGDPMEETIDRLVDAQAGRAVVVAAGNNRQAERHTSQSTVPFASVIGPDFEIDPFNPAGTDVVELVGYYPAGEDFEVIVFSPNGNVVRKRLTSSTVTPCDGADTPDGRILVCNTTGSQLGQNTSSREVIVQISDLGGTEPATGTWNMAITDWASSGSGSFIDFWISIATADSRFLDPREWGTVSIPGTAHRAVTVGSYSTRRCWPTAEGTVGPTDLDADDLGQISSFSGFATTHDGRFKPEIAAPGEWVVSALAEEVRAAALADPGTAPLVVNDFYLSLRGTSMAAPAVTGAVALLFEHNPGHDWADVRDLLEEHAREDADTEAEDQFPWLEPPLVSLPLRNPAFGHGKLNLGSWGFLDPWETNDIHSTARRILSGEVVHGRIEVGDDVDQYYIEGSTSGDEIAATLDSLPADYRLTVVRDRTLDNCGEVTEESLATSNEDGTAPEVISTTHLSSSEPTVVRVDSPGGVAVPGANYRLQAILTVDEGSDANDSISTARNLPELVEIDVDGDASSFLDQDFYRVTTWAGYRLEATVTPSLQWVSIRDGSGAILAGGTGSASVTLPGFPGMAPIDWYVVVEGDTFSPNSYDLTIRVTP